MSSESSGKISLKTSLTVRTAAYEYRNLGVHVHASGPVSLLVVSYGSHAIGEYPAAPYQSLNISEYVYYAVSTGSLANNAYGQILLIATEDSTTVTVTPTVAVKVPSDPQTDSDIETLSSGSLKTMSMKKLQTILVAATLSSVDLTGSKITSNKPLTVITGHECGNVPSDITYCETILEQIPPTATWGKQFLLSPYKDRGAQYYKILASSSSTTVKHNCKSFFFISITLTNAGSYSTIETVANKFCYLEANKPVLVTQMSPGSSKDSKLGDPAMSIIPPLEKYVKATSFYAPEFTDITSVYVNIVTKKKATFYLDKDSLSLTWTTISDTKYSVVGYSAQMSSISTETTHNITSSAEFYILVYGFGSNKAYSMTPGLCEFILHPLY